MTTLRIGIEPIPPGTGLAVFFDGDTNPMFRMLANDTWRPARGDLSWRVEDEATGRVVDEYHPPKPRHVSRIPTTPFITRS